MYKTSQGKRTFSLLPFFLSLSLSLSLPVLLYLRPCVPPEVSVSRKSGEVVKRNLLMSAPPFVPLWRVNGQERG